MIPCDLSVPSPFHSVVDIPCILIKFQFVLVVNFIQSCLVWMYNFHECLFICRISGQSSVDVFRIVHKDIFRMIGLCVDVLDHIVRFHVVLI